MVDGSVGIVRGVYDNGAFLAVRLVLIPQAVAVLVGNSDYPAQRVIPVVYGIPAADSVICVAIIDYLRTSAETIVVVFEVAVVRLVGVSNLFQPGKLIGLPLFLVPVAMRVYHTYSPCLEQGGA